MRPPSRRSRRPGQAGGSQRTPQLGSPTIDRFRADSDDSFGTAGTDTQIGTSRRTRHLVGGLSEPPVGVAVSTG